MTSLGNAGEATDGIVAEPNRENLTLWLHELTDLAPQQVEYLVENQLGETIQ
jgi:hypothetical protein